MTYIQGGDTIHTITADLAQDDFTVVSTTFSVDGTGTNPDSVALIKPSGSSASLAAGGSGVYTFTPDEPGVYVVQGTYGTEVVARTVRIGVEIAPGVWAEVLEDLDLPTIGAGGTISLTASGDADYTVGTATLHCSIDLGSGVAPDTFEVNANGLEIAKSGANTAPRIALGITDDYDVVAGDVVALQIEWEPQSVDANGNYLRTVITDDQEKAGNANSFKIDYQRTGAADYDAMRHIGVGAATKCADLGASLATTLQTALVGRGVVWVGHMDEDVSTPAPGNTIPRACFGLQQAGASKDYSAGNLYDLYSGTYHGMMFVLLNGTVYITRIRLLRARPVVYS